MEQCFNSQNVFDEILNRIAELVIQKLTPAEPVKTAAETPKLLSRADVCDKFGISKPTLREWVLDGRLPACKIGRRVFFRPDDVQNLLESGLTRYAHL